MHAIGPVMLSLVSLGVFIALSVALYAALPHSFLEHAERHGRFHGLGQNEPIRSGTPADSLPEAALIGQTA
jgi:hypothetical protein